MKIKFNDTFKSNEYLNYVEDLFSNYEHFRSKKYSRLALEIIRQRFPDAALWLTHSATGALEMIAEAIGIKPGDEVILSSFTFVSTANAFVSHGATPVFSEISLDDFNLDVSKIEANITSRTKAIIVTHYGGHSTDLTILREICQRHQLFLIEDAAMAYGNDFQGKPLGTFGDFATISFDVTKQISAIQGGLLICNRPEFREKLDHIYHIGTNRTQFMQHNKPYYEWVSVGSKYQMNELNALSLYDNLKHATTIFHRRNEISKRYFSLLKNLREMGIGLLSEEKLATNIHLFYLLLRSNEERTNLIQTLKNHEIEALFHYIPLHNSAMGKSFGEVHLPITEKVSAQLVRLPLHFQLNDADIDFVCETVNQFLK